MSCSSCAQAAPADPMRAACLTTVTLCRGGQVKAVHHVLNECLLDRGSSPSMVAMECFIDGYHLTNIIVRMSAGTCLLRSRAALMLALCTQADGLIISTPSGSTAYSMSAGMHALSGCVSCQRHSQGDLVADACAHVGGPMMAPSVPGALLTPIAPQSLSFRPLIVPESSSIEIRLPFSSRSHARCA